MAFVPWPTRVLLVVLPALLMVSIDRAGGQTIDDGSDRAIGPAATRTILDLIRQELDSPDAKVTVLRRSGDFHVCGSVNVKNREGLYTGERGFVVDLETRRFGRVPEGVELLNPRAAGFDQKEAVRQTYFRLCL